MKNIVVIAHENPIMRLGFISLLNQMEKIETIECETAEAAISICKSKNPDILITSFSLDSMGALQLTKRLKALSSKIKIIVSAPEKTGFIAEKAIVNGAHGYITSSINAAEFKVAVATVQQDAVYTEPCVSQRLALKKISGREHLFDSLSPREFDIFSKVIQDKTAKKVAQELFLAEKTVANYISIIKKKLHTKTSAGLLKIGLEEGVAETSSVH